MSTQPSVPKLNQQEREAIVDLLHLCIYADAHIAGKETDYVARIVEAMNWPPQVAFAAYEPRSIASARAARATAETLRDFLGHAAARLTSPEARAFAVDSCAGLAAADGTNERESSLLTQIKHAIAA